MKLSSPKITKTFSLHLDFIRGASALIVLLNHWRNIFFVDYGDITSPSLASKSLYFVASLGRVSVIIFFVLSGYLISKGVVRDIINKKWSWITYLQKRGARLYAVLIPALFLSALLDFSGSHIFSGNTIYYANIQYHVMFPFAIPNHMKFSYWISNLFFMQGILTPIFGSNMPLWSLGYEFWYYIIFPLCVLGFSARKRWSDVLKYLACAVVLFFFTGKEITIYFIVWLMGAFAAHLRWSPTYHKAIVYYISLFILLATVIIMRMRHAGGYLADFSIATAFTLFLLSSSWYLTGDVVKKSLSKPIIQFTSGFSYSLYLLHMPLLVFIDALIIGSEERWQPDMIHLIYGFAVMICVLLYTAAIWTFTESKTQFYLSKIILLTDFLRIKLGWGKAETIAPLR